MRLIHFLRHDTGILLNEVPTETTLYRQNKVLPNTRIDTDKLRLTT